MKKLNKSIDMFCYRHPRFGVPNLMLYIVIVSLAVWVFTLMDSTQTLLSFFVFSPAKILKGETTAEEMPYETVTGFNYYINSDAIAELGLTVPEAIADSAIESAE